MRGKPTWFIVKAGEHEGRAHLSGWMASAIKGEATGPRDDGWLAYSMCPVCFAMVPADKATAFGDLTWRHERWHAANDYPMPPEIEEADRG